MKFMLIFAILLVFVLIGRKMIISGISNILNKLKLVDRITNVEISSTVLKHELKNNEKVIQETKRQIDTTNDNLTYESEKLKYDIEKNTSELKNDIEKNSSELKKNIQYLKVDIQKNYDNINICNTKIEKCNEKIKRVPEDVINFSEKVDIKLKNIADTVNKSETYLRRSISVNEAHIKDKLGSEKEIVSLKVNDLEKQLINEIKRLELEATHLNRRIARQELEINSLKSKND